MSDDAQQALKTLAELVAKDNCVLFLGNDLPLGYPQTAPPCRDELAAALAADLDGVPFPVQGNLAKIARLYEGSRDRNTLVRRVIELTDNPVYRPTALHHQIATLPFRAILTAAQDRLLEQALRDAGRPHATVMTDVETPYIEEDKVMVYKLHGCISRPASLILTAKDECLLEKRLVAYLSVLRYLFVTRSLLFLNYSLDGRLFETLFNEVTANVEQHRRRAYAVWPAPAQAWKEIWAKDGLTLLDQKAGDLLDALARQVSRRERALAAETQTAPLIKPPYKFLDFYESTDRDIFYGRQIESVRFFRLILSHRLTVLFGASGTGKTSLLKAGVMPLLWEQGYATVYVRALDDPLAAVRSEVLALLRKQGRAIADPAARTLQNFFRAVLDPDDRLVVFLDQFEEFFLRLVENVQRRFWGELAAFRDLPPLPTGEGDRGGEVRFVFSLREDFLAPLDEARGQIPELLGDSYRLVNLSDDKASTVITEPAARAGLTIAPDLVSTLLDDLREEGVIAPPQLQIVCDRLYRDCLRDPDAVSAGAVPKLARTTATPADYRRLGGAKGILAGYVDYALAKLADDEARQAGRALLKVLVTSRATKAALDWPGLRNELAEGGDLDVGRAQGEDLARDVLAALVRLRLVREFERGGVALYELAHDHIAAEIATWINQAEMNAKLARELLRRELDSWRSLGKLIEPGALRLIHERRETLRRLTADELELLFRSALTASYEVSYWFQRAREGGVAVEGILRAGLESQTPNTRADAAAILGDLSLAEAVPWLAKALADDYLHVSVSARAALRKIGSPDALQLLADDRPKGMVYVPAGEFIMGDDEGDSDEKPAHKVYLDAFYIGKYPVTNAEYARFVECIGSRPPKHWVDGRPPRGKENHPVVNVSWYDAHDYARWAGMRLPTEAEWEKAASWAEGQRGGGAREWGRKRTYPWGDEFDKSRCNTDESGIHDTTPVGRYSPRGDSPYGCADMAGNVLEWTSSLHQDYPYRVDDGREDPASSQLRVVRGGSWYGAQWNARCACRGRIVPDLYNADLGFRVVVSLSS